MSDLETRISAYLAHRMPEARGVVVDELAQIYGGSSQQTYRLRARWAEGANTVERRLILRRDAPAGLVVAERDLEFNVYRALAGQQIPIPGVHFLELDPAWLDRPFFIMDLAPGKPGNPFSVDDPYEGHGEAIAREFWSILGRLAAIDHRAVGLDGLRNGKADRGFWSLELDRWEAILDENEAVIEPAIRGAMRWLRRNPPGEPAKPAIVHGDYRSGNFLFTPDGRISAILDWEMCHIGDSMEDIVWAIDPFWPITRHLPQEEGLACWEAASGIAPDRKALGWWQLFAAVKASVIWNTAEASFISGQTSDMTIALSGIRAGHFHRKLILKLMREGGDGMNFTLPDAIKGVAKLLHERILPEVGDNYTANMARMAVSVLNISANWVDDAAALRVDENAAIRAVLGEAAELADAGLAERLRGAAQSNDPGLRVSQLDAENHRLRVLLVEVQAVLERLDDVTARAMDQRIWRLLEEIEMKQAPRE